MFITRYTLTPFHNINWTIFHTQIEVHHVFNPYSSNPRLKLSIFVQSELTTFENVVQTYGTLTVKPGDVNILNFSLPIVVISSIICPEGLTMHSRNPEELCRNRV